MITFNKQNNIFHLYNNDISYVLMILKNKEIGKLYFGERIENDNLEYLYKEFNSEPSITPSFEGINKGFCLDTLLREYPDFGTGDFRDPAFDLEYENTKSIVEYEYVGHEIIKGYKEITGMPHIKVDKSQTLLIYLEDKLINSKITLKYTIFDEYPAVIRNAEIEGKNIKLNKLSSFNMDFLDSNYELIQLNGHWARECNYTRNEITKGIHKIDSKRGTSSAVANPFIALTRKNTDFDNGEAIGFNLLYSGNFSINVERSPFDLLRVNIGINDFYFSKNLDSKFETPEVLIVYSNKGINKMSQVFHDIYRNYLLAKKENYVLLNNWEGTYFDFNEEIILNMIDSANSLGIDLFVLDDGWFGKRDDDFRSLGDWYIHSEKLPNGLTKIIERCKQYNMKFGLWFEPEMANKDSDLYRKHNDYIIQTAGRKDHPSRNQHTLDFSRIEVVENIYDQMIKILDKYEIDYIKWDMNRCITGIDNKEKYHLYIKNLYYLLEKLKNRYKNILFEGCASGGNRFDAGMLYYTPQIWTSDNTDAIDRLDIQFGTSLAYPVTSQGSHVSVTPNHQTGRMTSLEIRRNVAMLGTFGYELNPLNLNEDEKEKIRKDIKIYKKYAKTINYGDLYRIIHDQNETAYSVVNKEKSEALLFYYKRVIKIGTGLKTLKIKGLKENFKYKVSRINLNREEEKIGIFYGSFLDKFGIYREARFSGQRDEENRYYSDYDTDLYVIEEI